MTTVAELPAGFADKVLSAQTTFRSVMDAIARPGTVQRIAVAAGAPYPMMHGTAAIALTLFDHDTPVWLDQRMSETPDVSKWLKFHTGAPVIADSSVCHFALFGEAGMLPALDRFAFGTNEYPDRSTQGPTLELRGPGIDGTAELKATIQPADLFERLAINAVLFPCGIDVVLVDDDSIVAIPRTTRLAARGD
jgi:alpha-D-ribose 1-methylphosphonate 5-triphosphate synthase subunit PhnH